MELIDGFLSLLTTKFLRRKKLKKLGVVLVLSLLALTLCFANGAAEKTEKTIVTFWNPYGEGSWSGEYLAGIIEKFNAENPDIEVQAQPMTDYGTIIESLQRAAAGDSLPSIVSIGYGYDRYVLNSGKAVSYNNYLPTSFFDDFFDAALDVTTFDGQVYGIPFALSVPVVFYHSDLFEKAGLDPNKAPKTWAEFIEASKTIHEKLGIYGATFALDDPWSFECLLNSKGGAFLNEDGTIGVNSTAAKDLLSDWAAGAKGKYFLYNADFFETLQTFGAKQVAMFVVSSYGTVTYHDSNPEIISAPIPTGTAEDEIQAPIGGNSIYLFGNSEAERAAAAKFVAYLTGPEMNAEWAKNSGYLPTRESSLEALGSWLDDFDNYETALDQINNVTDPTQWPWRNVLQINSYIMEAIEAAMLGAKDASTALDAAAAKIAPLMK